MGSSILFVVVFRNCAIMYLLILEDNGGVRDCINIYHVTTNPNPFFVSFSFNGRSGMSKTLGLRPVPDPDEIPHPKEVPKPLVNPGVKLEHGDNWWNSDKGCKNLGAVNYDELESRQEMMVKGLYLTEGERKVFICGNEAAKFHDTDPI